MAAPTRFCKRWLDIDRAAADTAADGLVMLARRRRRRLRSWLSSASRTPRPARSVRAEEIQAEVGFDHRSACSIWSWSATSVAKAIVTLLLYAVREATVNAAKHAEADLVIVYIKIEANSVTAFVRDKGVGFYRAKIADDRRGPGHLD